MNFNRLIGLLVLVGMLAACGYKADLYLETDGKSTDQEAVKSEDEDKKENDTSS